MLYLFSVYYWNSPTLMEKWRKRHPLYDMCWAAYEMSNVALSYLNTLSTIFTVSIFFRIFFLWFFSRGMASLFILILWFFFFFFPSPSQLQIWVLPFLFFPFLSFWWDPGTFSTLNPPKISPSNLQFFFFN